MLCLGQTSLKKYSSFTKAAYRLLLIKWILVWNFRSLRIWILPDSLLPCVYHLDTCFDAHLFRRLFCLYHVMLCARSDDITACFLFVNNIVLHCQEKNKFKVRDSKVRHNRFCQCIAVWSNFLRFKITYYIEAKFSPS